MSIIVENFHKTYGDTVAVAGLTFKVQAGEILGLVGPNGAGKTTTLRALAGILTPTRGRLLITGHDLANEAVAAKAALAYMPDEPRLFDQLTVWEHFRFIASAYRLRDWSARAEALLAQFELAEKRDTLAADLSRGMRQKVAICCGYLHQPRVIMLDEPLTGLDPYGIRAMNDSIRTRAHAGAAIIISSHLLHLVEEICSHVLILKGGRKIIDGTLDEIRLKFEHDGDARLEDVFLRLIEEEWSER